MLLVQVRAHSSTHAEIHASDLIVAFFFSFSFFFQYLAKLCVYWAKSHLHDFGPERSGDCLLGIFAVHVFNFHYTFASNVRA